MAASGALTCCKTLCCVLLVFVNIISIIFGVLFAVVGILLLCGSTVIQGLSDIAKVDGSGTNQTSSASIGYYYSSFATLSGSAAGLLIAFGVIIVVVSCIGCFGACIGIPACLIIYVVCLSLLFIGQVIVIIIWFAKSDLFKHSIRGTLEQQVQKFRGEQNQNVDSAMLNMIQALFGCCGVDNGTDFLTSSPDWNRTHSIVDANNGTVTFNLTYPVTCCKFNINTYKPIDPYCPYNGSTNAAVSNFRTGCYEKVWLVMDTYLELERFFYGLCGCLGLEILLIIGALIIHHAKKQQMRELSIGHGEVEYKMVQQKA